MNSLRVGETIRHSVVCPVCGTPNEALTRVDGDGLPNPDGAPLAGPMLLVCFECTAYLVLNDGVPHELTDDEWLDLPFDVREAVAAVRRGLQAVKRKRRGGTA